MLVYFTYIDDTGEMQYGSYSTYNQQELSSVIRVAYHIYNPKQYRVLGRNYEWDFTTEGSSKGLASVLLMDILFNTISQYLWEKKYTELIIMILWIAILGLTAIIALQFYHAL